MTAVAEPPWVREPDDGGFTEVVEGLWAPPKLDPDVDTFLTEPEPEYDWLVPDILERQDRIILTAGEGHGKTTLFRQFCVQCASGQHPFTLAPIEPVRCLMVDLENGRRHVRRQLRPLRVQAGKELDPENLRVRVMPEGINLAHPDHFDALRWSIEAAGAGLLAIGPLYKLADGDPTEEKVAKPVAVCLDRLRVEFDLAIMLEAHVPHSATAGGKRAERPYGASLWMRWPEFGLFLSPEGQLRHWRGPRDERQWPAALKRGGEWPWTVATRVTDVTWARMVEEARTVPGVMPTVRDLAVRLSCSKAQVQRAIDANKAEWERLRVDGG